MDKKIVEAIESFKLSLEELGVRTETIVVFGSYAAGTAEEHSDIDLAVISDDFRGVDIFSRLEILGLALARAKIMEPVEALAYTPEEYESKEQGTFIADEVKAKGIRVL